MVLMAVENPMKDPIWKAMVPINFSTYGRKIISSVWLNGNITKETFHFEEVLFYEVILLNWYNNKHDFINVGKGISEKEFKVSKEPQKELEKPDKPGENGEEPTNLGENNQT